MAWPGLEFTLQLSHSSILAIAFTLCTKLASHFVYAAALQLGKDYLAHLPMLCTTPAGRSRSRLAWGVFFRGRGGCFLKEVFWVWVAGVYCVLTYAKGCVTEE